MLSSQWISRSTVMFLMLATGQSYRYHTDVQYKLCLCDVNA